MNCISDARTPRKIYLYTTEIMAVIPTLTKTETCEDDSRKMKLLGFYYNCLRNPSLEKLFKAPLSPQDSNTLLKKKLKTTGIQRNCVRPNWDHVNLVNAQCLLNSQYPNGVFWRVFWDTDPKFALPPNPNTLIFVSRFSLAPNPNAVFLTLLYLLGQCPKVCLTPNPIAVRVVSFWTLSQSLP